VRLKVARITAMEKTLLKRFIKFNFSIGLLVPLLFVFPGDIYAICGVGQVETALGCITPTPNGLANWFLLSSLGIASGVALLLILVGGIKYITSQGDFKAIDEAKKTITSALVGFLVIFLSVLILAIVGGGLVLDIPGWHGEFFAP